MEISNFTPTYQLLYSVKAEIITYQEVAKLPHRLPLKVTGLYFYTL